MPGPRRAARPSVRRAGQGVSLHSPPGASGPAVHAGLGGRSGLLIPCRALRVPPRADGRLRWPLALPRRVVADSAALAACQPAVLLSLRRQAATAAGAIDEAVGRSCSTRQRSANRLHPPGAGAAASSPSGRRQCVLGGTPAMAPGPARTPVPEPPAPQSPRDVPYSERATGQISGADGAPPAADAWPGIRLLGSTAAAWERRAWSRPQSIRRRPSWRAAHAPRHRRPDRPARSGGSPALRTA